MSDPVANRQILPIFASIAGGIAFYTAIPLPPSWPLEFGRIARWAPWVGVTLGGSLLFCDLVLGILEIPVLVRSASVVAIWVLLTGGLHLDGAMDVADGLGSTDPARRLEIMRDSTVGAYGAIAAVGVLGLKTLALAAIPADLRWPILIGVPVWGRWGQLAAIARYSYLRPEGKGRFHRDNLVLPWDPLVGSLPGVGVCLAIWGVWPEQWRLALALLLGGIAISAALAAWLQRQLGGQTGDTYGAIVEWTEAILLVVLSAGIIQPGAGG